MTDTSLEAFRKTYPIQIQRPMHWGEMDAFGHLNNVNYFRYFEAVRIHFLELITVDPKEKTKGKLIHFRAFGTFPVVAWTECHYQRPLTYPDTLEVGCKIKDVGASQVVHEYAIFSHEQQRPTTIGGARLVFIDTKSHNKAEIPKAIKARIIQIYNQGV